MSAPAPRPRGRFAAFFEICGAWALAVAWPIFQGSTSSPEGFTQIDLTRVDLVFFLLATMVAGPVLLWLLELIVTAVRPSFGVTLHALILGGLFALVAWQAAHFLHHSLLTTLSLLAGTVALTAVWLRFAYIRNVTSLLSFAFPVVLIAFLLTAPARAVWLPAKPLPTMAATADGAPVVVLLLDEFPLAGIESAPDRIDRRNFPNFGRLASPSDWYSNARSNADVTINALPALLTGKAPTKPHPPAVRDYPENLFTLLGATGYRLDVSEKVTDLCPTSLCPSRGNTRQRVSRALINGLEFGNPLPSVIETRIVEALRPTDDVFTPPPGEDLRSFVDSIDPKPGTLSFGHVLLPHIPWIYLPDGSDYLGPIAPGILPEKVAGDDHWDSRRPLVDVSFQQAMLQAAFVDRELGRMIRTMKRAGTWDQTLFVVAADHGASFQAGGTRRYLTAENSGWITPVPLFVKFPGQRVGRKVKATAESVDLLPTMLASLGLDIPSDLDGVRLDQPITDQRRTPALSSRLGRITLREAGVRKRFLAAVRYRNRSFPTGSLWDLGRLPELIGRQTRRIPGIRPVAAEYDAPWPVAEPIPIPGRLPAQVSGSLTAGKPGESLAFSLNGRIVATSRTWQQDGRSRFSVILPPDAFREGPNRVKAFRIGRSRSAKAGDAKPVAPNDTR